MIERRNHFHVRLLLVFILVLLVFFFFFFFFFFLLLLGTTRCPVFAVERARLNSPPRHYETPNLFIALAQLCVFVLLIVVIVKVVDVFLLLMRSSSFFSTDIVIVHALSVHALPVGRVTASIDARGDREEWLLRILRAALYCPYDSQREVVSAQSLQLELAGCQKDEHGQSTKSSDQEEQDMRLMHGVIRYEGHV